MSRAHTLAVSALLALAPAAARAQEAHGGTGKDSGPQHLEVASQRDAPRIYLSGAGHHGST